MSRDLSHAERSVLALIRRGARVSVDGRRATITLGDEGHTTGAGVLRSLVAFGLIHPDLTPVKGDPCGAADCRGAPWPGDDDEGPEDPALDIETGDGRTPRERLGLGGGE
jgi:hypothetical protein